jgi:hypothetical protein
MNITALWAIAPCSLVEVDGRLKGSYCLHHQGDGGSSTRYGTSSLGSAKPRNCFDRKKSYELGNKYKKSVVCKLSSAEPWVPRSRFRGFAEYLWVLCMFYNCIHRLYIIIVDYEYKVIFKTCGFNLE